MDFCRVCKGAIFKIQDFGLMPRANAFEVVSGDDKFRFNLATAFCNKCFLFQIVESPKPSDMFNSDYPFFTGMSRKMIQHFREFAHDEVIRGSSSSTKVIEVGSNDGTLLQVLHDAGISYVGIDASESAVKKAQAQGLHSIQAFFGRDYVEVLKETFGKVDYVLGANVVCHIPDLVDFFVAVSQIIKDDGSLIFEEPYLGDMLNLVSYDQIYDEHIFIFSAISIDKILTGTNLELVDVNHQETHGGSMRYTVKRKGVATKTTRLLNTLKMELEMGYSDVETFNLFASKCGEKRDAFVNLLKDLREKNMVVVGYGATSKSTTILNYCNLDSTLIRAIGDSTPEKIGKFTPGTGIPVVSHETIRDMNPDYVVLFAWNHAKEILMNDDFFKNPDIRIIFLTPGILVSRASDANNN